MKKGSEKGRREALKEGRKSVQKQEVMILRE